MVGVSLSRWTMSYFAAALVALLAAEIMMATGFGFPAVAIASPDTLILVHVVAIGWLSLLMCGALFQFLPVLVVQPLHSNALAVPALVSLLAGLAALVLALLQFGGRIDLGAPFFTAAAVLLGLGFALVLYNLVRTMIASKTVPLPAWFVAAGLASVVSTVALGAIFSLVLGGVIESGPLLALTGAGLPIHAIAGLGGWLTFTAIGVSYRLLAMFMLAPELDGARPKSAFYLGTAALAIVIVGGVVTVLLEGNLLLTFLAALAVALPALAFYGADAIHLYRARKRRNIELNSHTAGIALGCLAASVALIVVLLALGRLSDHVGAVVFLVAFGWLTGLGLSQLYKIVAFLTWLECYGPVLGKIQTPRVQDLVVEARAIKWFVLYFAAVGVGAVALLAEAPTAFRFAAVAMAVGTTGIAAQLIRTRRLADVKAEARLPQGVRLPHLLLSCHT
jgi:hypothetical protein